MATDKITVNITDPRKRVVITRPVGGSDLLTMETGHGPPVGEPAEGVTAYLDLDTGIVYEWSDD